MRLVRLVKAGATLSAYATAGKQNRDSTGELAADPVAILLSPS